MERSSQICEAHNAPLTTPYTTDAAIGWRTPRASQTNTCEGSTRTYEPQQLSPQCTQIHSNLHNPSRFHLTLLPISYTYVCLHIADETLELSNSPHALFSKWSGNGNVDLTSTVCRAVSSIHSRYSKKYAAI